MPGKNVSHFPNVRENSLLHTILKQQQEWFGYWRYTHLNRSNNSAIMSMSFILICSLNNLCEIFPGLILIVLNRSTVSNEKVNGRVLSLDIGWHCLLDKLLKIIAFSAKFEAHLSLTNKWGITGVFYPSTEVLIIDQ